MDPILSALSQVGLGVATNAVYDYLKGLTSTRSYPSQQVVQELQNRINLTGLSVRAETVIEALARNGVLHVENSHLHANNGLVFGSVTGSAVFGNNSSMTTAKTAMTAGQGAYVQTNGNAQIRHNPDGSIDFLVG
jgi:hypothetical protein